MPPSTHSSSMRLKRNCSGATVAEEKSRGRRSLYGGSPMQAPERARQWYALRLGLSSIFPDFYQITGVPFPRFGVEMANLRLHARAGVLPLPSPGAAEGPPKKAASALRRLPDETRRRRERYFNSPLSPIVMPPGPAFFFASIAFRVSMAFVRHSSALATSSLRAASLP